MIPSEEIDYELLRRSSYGIMHEHAGEIRVGEILYGYVSHDGMVGKALLCFFDATWQPHIKAAAYDYEEIFDIIIYM